HLLRGVKIGQDRLLRSRTATEVTTVAGTGRQWMQGSELPRGEGDARSFDLSTPWDLCWSHVLDRAVIAMAGIHQIWTFDPGSGLTTCAGGAAPRVPGADRAGGAGAGRRSDLSAGWRLCRSRGRGRARSARAGGCRIWTFDPVTGNLMVLAGTTQEGLVDGPVVTSWWAQPSGLDELPDGRIVVADSETSAVRVLDPHDMQVTTLVGEGLFDFGHVDGPAADARLQHPLGVTALPD